MLIYRFCLFVFQIAGNFQFNGYHHVRHNAHSHVLVWNVRKRVHRLRYCHFSKTEASWSQNIAHKKCNYQAVQTFREILDTMCKGAVVEELGVSRCRRWKCTPKRSDKIWAKSQNLWANNLRHCKNFNEIILLCHLWRGNYFILVEFVPGTQRKSFFLFYLQCFDEHILSCSLLHVPYVNSSMCNVTRFTA